MDMTAVSRFFMTPSFEPRSTVALRTFMDSGGSREAVRALNTSESQESVSGAIEELTRLGIPKPQLVNRLSSRRLWEWVWANTEDSAGRVAIDATCFNREIICMLLFALAVRREHLEDVLIQYVPVGARGYASHDSGLADGNRWLSKGIIGVRSILGYPGKFSSEKRLRVVALAGHEKERLLNAIEFLEPYELSISSERSGSSTVQGAGEISKSVAEELRGRIQVPNISEVKFSADSIEQTFDSLSRLMESCANENVAILAMNTKLSSVGVALAALQKREIRLVYTVPEEYNPRYSSDFGDVKTFNITGYIRASRP